MVELDDWRVAVATQFGIQPRDLRPVGCVGAGGAGVKRADRGLELVGADLAHVKGFLYQRQPFLNRPLIPLPTILLAEHDQLAGRTNAGRAPRMVQQHQAKQAQHLGVVAGWHVGARLADEPFQHAAQADGLGAQLVANQRFASAGRVALGEDQVDHRQHGVEPFGQQMRRRHGVGNARISDLALGAHQPLGHGWRGHQKRRRDLGRRQAAERVQSKGDLLLLRQGRVAAREDQLEPLVGDVVGFTFCLVGAAGGQVRVFQRHGGAAAAQPVDCFAAGGGGEPRARPLRHARARPVLHRRQKRILQRFFGQLNIAQPADQHGKQLAMLLAVHALQSEL